MTSESPDSSPTGSRSCTPDASSRQGPVAELLEQPAHPYTQGLLKCVPKVSRRQRPLPTMTGTAEDAWALSEGCRFAPRCPLVIDQCRRDEPSLARDDRREALAACWMAGGEARPTP